MTDATTDLLVEVDATGVMLMTMNRPDKMNSFSEAMRAQLLEALQRASHDDAIRAVVLTGAGRAFCAGADVSAIGRRQDSGYAAPTTSRHDRMERLGGPIGSVSIATAFAECDVPIIAAVNGPAAGAGFSLACCCDLRFVGESARMGPIFILRGVVSDYGGAYWLPRIVGTARAYEMFYEGKPVSSERTLAIGLAQRVVADEQLLPETLAYARQLAAGPPAATTATRRLIRASLDLPLSQFLELEWGYQAVALRSKDAAEGFRSFLEKRPPQFTGE